MDKKNRDQNLAIIFGLLFVVTLIAFIAYAISKAGEFERGMDAAATLSAAEEFFLGDDDPHTKKITRNDGSMVSLYPSAYSIDVTASDGSRGTLGSVHSLGHRETTNQNIIWFGYLGESGQHESAFVDPNQRSFVRLDDKAFDRTNTVDFSSHDPYLESSSFTLTTNVPDRECEDLYVSNIGFQGFVDECNKKGAIFLSEILVNGEVAYSFAPIELTRVSGGPEAPMGYAPSTWIHLVGVSPELDRAYFEFPDTFYFDDEDNEVDVEFPHGPFSIDSEGNVEPTEFPEDMVTFIY